MMFLPYDHYRIHTDIAPQVARDRLAAQVRAPSWTRLFRPSAGPPFEGTVGERAFKIQRIVGYRNSFLPVVRGTIRPAAGGSEIEITMRMQMPVIVFMLLWFGLLGAFLILGVSGESAANGGAGTGCAVGLFMFAAAYGMMIIGFQVEAAKARTFLRDLFAEPGVAIPAGTPVEPVASPASQPRAPSPWVGGAPESLKYGAESREDEDASSSRP
jgi:hypothetical protein